jgi:hypothetical protein
MKTAAEYQRDSRARRAERGLVRWEVFASAKHIAALKSKLAELLAEPVTKKSRRTP